MSNLLIVDDERSLREVLQIVFKKEGYKVSVASSYQEAVAQVKAAVYDLVVSDIKMNDGNGIDLLKDIKAANPETLVVMITAYATTEMPSKLSKWVPWIIFLRITKILWRRSKSRLPSHLSSLVFDKNTVF